MAYWELKWPILTVRLDRHTSQPTGFSGRREATRAPTATKQVERRCGSSSHRLLEPVPWFLLPRHHSTALPSAKRYDNRYESLFSELSWPTPENISTCTQ